MDDLARLSPAALRLVGSYWWQRAAGEITSWVGWRHVLGDLCEEQSPAAVLALAERAVADEHRHALWCRDWAVRFGHPGGDPSPRTEQRLARRGATDAENRLLRITLCCFTETVGCYTLKHARAAVGLPELRALNRRHLADELQHGRAGWAHLSTLGHAGRDWVRAALPELLRLVEAACCDGDEGDHEELVPYGYFTARLLRAAHDEALHDVVLPGLRHVGILEAA